MIMNYAETYNPFEGGRKNDIPYKERCIYNIKISQKVKPLTPEEVDEMLLHDDTYESDKVLMKCDRCGCEMELDGYILSEIAEADGDDELSCICMKCGKGTMHQVKK